MRKPGIAGRAQPDMAAQPPLRRRRYQPERQRGRLPDRVDAGVHLQRGSPASLDEPALGLVAHPLFVIEVIEAAAFRFEMAQFDPWSPQDPESARAQFEGEIDVAIGDRQADLVKSAGGFE